MVVRLSYPKGPEASVFSKLGQIIDISPQGLSFRYTVTGTQANEAFELDIFLAGDGFYLEKIPFKTVSDRKLPKKVYNGHLPMRRCGVQFGQLMPIQMAQLKHFIQTHTIK